MSIKKATLIAITFYGLSFIFSVIGFIVRVPRAQLDAFGLINWVSGILGQGALLFFLFILFKKQK